MHCQDSSLSSQCRDDILGIREDSIILMRHCHNYRSAISKCTARFMVNLFFYWVYTNILTLVVEKLQGHHRVWCRYMADCWIQDSYMPNPADPHRAAHRLLRRQSVSATRDEYPRYYERTTYVRRRDLSWNWQPEWELLT